MSSISIDASGARSLQVTLNDPETTKAWMPSKAGDDAQVVISGTGELRLELPANARLQRRRYKVTTRRGSDAEETHDEDRLILVLSGATLFYRSSQELVPEAERKHEGHPHVSAYVRRWKDKHALESGELVEEVELSPSHEAWEDSVGRIVGALADYQAP
jgi:hypothetical protein